MSYLASLSPNFAQNQSDLIAREGKEFTPEDMGVMGGALDLEVPLNAATRGLVAEPAVALSLAASNVPRAVDAAFGTDAITWWHENVTDEAVAFRRSLKIDTVTHGVAAQVIDSLASVIPQAVLTGPVGVGVFSGIGEAGEQIGQGKSASTAGELGAITGLSNAVGVAMPAAFGKTLAQRIATGAASNVGIGAISDAAKHKVLADAGYHDQAEQYKWNSGQSRAIDAVLGAAFGGLAHWQAVHETITVDSIKPSDVDAALTLNEARRIDDSAPGIPKTAAAATAHADALQSAIDALKAGDDVINHADANNYLPNPIHEELHAERMADAVNILTRGDRQNLEYEKIDLEYKLNQFDEQSSRQGYTKADFIDQARAENPRMPARKVAAIAEQMAKDAKANDRSDLQSALDRTNHQLERDRLARERFSELSRDEPLAKPEFIKNEVNKSTVKPELPLSNHETNSELSIKPRSTGKELGKNTDNQVNDTLFHARNYLEKNGDIKIPHIDDDGNETIMSLKQLLDESDLEMTDSARMETATTAAINCFLKFGEPL